MREGARTAATMAVLVVLLVVGAAWGFSAATQPFPGKVTLPTCEDKSVAKGDKVYPSQVTVSVYNAGTREGLAGRTMQLLTDAGFAAGESGNAPHHAKVDVTEIWTTDPSSPAVRLVDSWLGPRRTKVVRRDAPGPGVVVVVGDGFTDLVKGRQKIRARQDATICSPPVR
ncbi:MAG: LytR C-terminal domain-containing protein [Nocardioides sp.]